MIIRLLRLFTKIWTTLVSILIFMSLSFLWYSEGFSKIQEVLNPFNITNIVITMIAFSPAFITYLLANKLENNNNPLVKFENQIKEINKILYEEIAEQKYWGRLKEINQKGSAIKIVNDYFSNKILKNNNTHFANISTTKYSEKEVWRFNIPQKKFSKNLHLLLHNNGELIWIKISANTFSNISETFRIREDNSLVDIKISSLKDNYMTDIKSGYSGYNFSKHIKHKFTFT